jgi:glycosyltransferase involved in cell wall biosynthesis
LADVDISILIPFRNESKATLVSTVESFVFAKARSTVLEFVLVDDCSDEQVASLGLSDDVSVKFVRNQDRRGVGASRNRAASVANGKWLFITDAHVAVSKHFDASIIGGIEEQVRAATIKDMDSNFCGFGCSLALPFVGTTWNRKPLRQGDPVQIPASSGTIISRSFFRALGGYDEGMVIYGGFEPEFGIRCWLAGGSVVSAPEIHIHHRFKSRSETKLWLREHHYYIIHNQLRAAICYYSDPGVLYIVSYLARKFPEELRKALEILDVPACLKRRSYLVENLKFDLRWFFGKFNLDEKEHSRLV